MKKFLFAILLLTSCQAVTVPPVVPVIPIGYTGEWDKNHKEWTPLLVKALQDFGQPLLQGGFKEMCGEKLQWWISFISAMADEESGFDANQKYTEKFPDSKGNRQVSLGLLQVSLDDAGIYGCEFKTEADALDPRKNLECGVRILSKQIARDGVIAEGSKASNAKGGARYFSTLRTGPNDGPKKDKIFARAKASCI